MIRDIYWGNEEDGVIEVARGVPRSDVFKEMRHFILEHNIKNNRSWSLSSENPVVVDYGSWSYFFYVFGGDITDGL